MMGFGIDQLQAEFVAEIKLRNINREYILKRTAETEALEKEIADLTETLGSRRRIKSIIIDELRQINKKYVTPRRSAIVYSDEIEDFEPAEEVEDYPVTLFLSDHGYFKKITAQSLRMSGEHKYKEGDRLTKSFESSNGREVLFLTDRQQMYKCRVSDFEDMKASALGVYLPTKLEMDEGESVIAMIDPDDYSKHLLIVFENGKAARIELSAYETKANRRKLINAYSDKSPAVSVTLIDEERDMAVYSIDGRVVVFNTAQILPKTTRSTQGVGVMSLKKGRKVVRAEELKNTAIRNVPRYRVRTLPAAGALLKPEDREEQQLSLMDE
jgi:DNA gyrase subunit A